MPTNSRATRLETSRRAETERERFFTPAKTGRRGGSARDRLFLWVFRRDVLTNSATARTSTPAPSQRPQVPPEVFAQDFRVRRRVFPKNLPHRSS